MIEHKQLLELLHYDPMTGIFIRKICLSNRNKVGDIAASPSKNGYLDINVAGKRYPAHSLAWFYVYAKWPKTPLDHVNRNPKDNRISNLRESSKQQNAANTGIQRNNTTGYKGVIKFRKKFIARIKVNYTSKHLGCFSDPVEAAKAYDMAALANFGNFAVTNKRLGLI